MAGGCTVEVAYPVGKPGTASQFQRRELVAVPALRLSGTGGQVDGFGEAAAALQALAIEFPALRERGLAVMHVEVFQALAGQVGAGVSDGTFGDEAATQRDVAHQFAGQGAPSESPARNGQHGGLLLAEADFLAAGGGDLERHADLIDGEEGGDRKSTRLNSSH